MIRALVIALLFWVVVVPGGISSFLIVRFLLEANPSLHSFFLTLEVGVTIFAAVLGPLLFPLQIAAEFDRSFYDSKITKPGGHKC